MVGRSHPSEGGIFVSYRRDDAAFAAAWLYDRLVTHFGADSVFRDVDSVGPGEDFLQAITDSMRSCYAVLVVIGPNWLDAPGKDGGRRLDSPDDLVRRELEIALTAGKRIVPILVEGAQMPRPEQLPPTVASLAYRNALEVHPTRSSADIARLVSVLDAAAPQGRTRPKAHESAPGAGASPGAPPRTAQGAGRAADRARTLMAAVGRRRWLASSMAAVVVVALVAVVLPWNQMMGGGTRTPPDGAPTAGGPPQFVVDSIPVRGRVQSLALDPENHTLYTGNLDGDTQVFDTNTGSLTGTIPIDSGVSHLALDPRDHLLYGDNFNDRTVQVIDTVDREVVHTISLPDNPIALTRNGISGSLYVATANNPDILVIDPADPTRVSGTITSAPWPVALAADASGELTLQLLFIATSDGGGSDPAAGNHVLLADAEPKVFSGVPLDSEPAGIVFDRNDDPESGAGTIYVSTDDGSVVFVDVAAKAIVAEVPAGRSPGSVAIDPERDLLYVANYDDNNVTVINTVSRQVISTVPVGNHPSMVVVDPLTHVAYCANVGDTSVSVIRPTG